MQLTCSPLCSRKKESVQRCFLPRQELGLSKGRHYIQRVSWDTDPGRREALLSLAPPGAYSWLSKSSSTQRHEANAHPIWPHFPTEITFTAHKAPTPIDSLYARSLAQGGRRRRMRHIDTQPCSHCPHNEVCGLVCAF